MKKESSVFYISAGILLMLVIFGVLSPGMLETATANMQEFITGAFGWYYLIIFSVIVVVALYFLISPLGKIKLGKQDDKPEFSRGSWFAMLFSAGMGIGLVFWGTAEPISHSMLSTPTGVEPGSDQAIRDAMRYSFFHWGIHAWAVYGVVALVLAYFNFRHNKPGLISAALEPVLGRHSLGAAGKAVDVIAVIATVTGVATTLGFGAVQINGGLNFLYGIETSFLVQLVIVVIVTVLFIISAMTGLGNGIKILSNVNMVLAFALFLMLFILGPTLFNLNLFTNTLGSYIQNLPAMSFRIAPLDGDIRSWIDDWTIFYWAWWIAWAPFVGVFIARISKGRTIREFIFCVLFLPSVVSFLWFSVFGGTAIHLEQEGIASISSLATEEALFGVLAEFPLSTVMSLLAIALVVVFFITSADSGTFVLGMLSSRGSFNPSGRIKVVWGIMMSVTALVLLYSGGLQAIQNMMIVAALPFSIVMGLMVWSLIKALRKEALELGIGRIPSKQPQHKKNI